MARSIMSLVRRTLGAHAVGFVALVAALGAPAGAAVIVSSNSQVGTGVLAGAAAPAGVTDNVIGSSIGAGDLAANAAAAPQLADGAVTSAKIAGAGVAGKDLADGAVAPAGLASQAVGPAALAPGAVTATKLGAGLRRRVALDLVPAAGRTSFADAAIGGLDLFLSCAAPAGGGPVQLRIIPADYTDQPGVFELSAIAQSTGGAARPVMSSTTVGPYQSQPALTDVSNEQGTGTIVWQTGAQLVQGDLHWLADATHCALHGLLMASHG